MVVEKNWRKKTPQTCLTKISRLDPQGLRTQGGSNQHDVCIVLSVVFSWAKVGVILLRFFKSFVKGTYSYSLALQTISN